MKHMKRSMLACMLATVLMGLLLTTPVAQAASAVTCPGWNLIASPNAGLGDYLSGVAAVSASDAWAVGYYGGSSAYQTLIEHWNGSSWSVVPSPNIGSSHNQLTGVAAVSASDAWAVGSYEDISTSSHPTLIEHWDGTSWSIISSPSYPSSFNELSGVAAVSATDVWAVGYGPIGALIEHWNGSTWSIVSNPSVGSGSKLSGVAAVSATDVWAVGRSGYQTLIEHWNGTSWQVIPSPNPASSYNLLLSVAALSASNVWAVGYDELSQYGPIGALIEHWNGSNWSPVSSPSDGSIGRYLFGVAVVSANNVWAVGITSSNGVLIEHWNGTSWKVVKGAPIGKGLKTLNGVARVPGSRQLWTVGNWRPPQQATQTLIELHC